MPSIANNLAANTSLRYLGENSAMQSNSLSKIASGKRIERASDDAAGLAVSTALRSDINILSQSSINADQGIAVLQTADGALARMDDVLQRMGSLAAQSINGSVDDNAREYIDAEFQQLVDELDAIGNGTEFNGTQLLGGSYQEQFLVGTDGSTSGSNANRLTVAIENFRTEGLQGFATKGTQGGATPNVDYRDGSVILDDAGFTATPDGETLTLLVGKDTDGNGTLAVADAEVTQVVIDFDNAAGILYTYTGARAEAVTSNLTALDSAVSTVNDFINAINASGLVTAGVRADGGLDIKATEAGAFMSVVGMEAIDDDFTDTTDVDLANADGDQTSVNLTSPGSVANANADADNGDYISVDTLANAEIAANIVDGAIQLVSEARAEIGAQISRFEFRADVIDTSVENITAANSSILDADIAKEQTEFTNAETLTEAAISALSKANELPQELLRLLQ